MLVPAGDEWGDWACCWVLIGEPFLPPNPDLPDRQAVQAVPNLACNGLLKSQPSRRRRHISIPLHPPPPSSPSRPVPFPPTVHEERLAASPLHCSILPTTVHPMTVIATGRVGPWPDLF